MMISTRSGIMPDKYGAKTTRRQNRNKRPCLFLRYMSYFFIYDYMHLSSCSTQTNHAEIGTFPQLCKGCDKPDYDNPNPVPSLTSHRPSENIMRP